MVVECELVAILMLIYRSYKCHSFSFAAQPLAESNVSSTRSIPESSRGPRQAENMILNEKSEKFRSIKKILYLLLINCVSFLLTVES